MGIDVGVLQEFFATEIVFIFSKACLIGLAVLAFLTASFSTLLMGRDMNGMARDESQILAELMRLHERLDRLESGQLAKTDRPSDETFPPQME